MKRYYKWTSRGEIFDLLSLLLSLYYAGAVG
jgi:hypothetical protein